MSLNNNNSHNIIAQWFQVVPHLSSQQTREVWNLYLSKEEGRVLGIFIQDFVRGKKKSQLPNPNQLFIRPCGLLGGCI